ncbi:uncharacterized protein H6S33_011228 [Morchella sextelata]|uniref:uncharacterized protein n=1 Tax=Morchella sextelata TaxID=1174677 RepID=UPI001D03FBA8|nr:uncharacterized protein H6S33_009802 [Morchella sextelata]XP_044695996.1 uncharacterized protein H6S33_011228 [Morchella sextelata]KAH0602315.1 hypothetical protein H6S33_009802 [Morchella sextelata]KAH0610801.1 hypothetical protein H6S33_011228 [Morchella sextelata]
MPISILPPRDAHTDKFAEFSRPDEHYEGEEEDEDMEGDIAMDDSSTRKRGAGGRMPIVTPGEVVTSDPQWMRGHGTYLAETEEGEMGTSIVATVAGSVTKTNKLLSVKPLRARYTPDIGDLVVGRIMEVQSKRWKVDINSTQTAHLLLSSINLPGGILRKRTSTDELQIRTFFSEGDLLVAEVQSLFQDGAASLHTRSLKYGKLRNGHFIKVDPKGIQRSKSHILTLTTANGGGEVDVILGINGYVWISKRVTGADGKKDGKEVSITRLEEEASEAIYSSVNEFISPATRREISRVGNCVTALVRHNVRVDEEILNAVYEAAVEESVQMEEESLEGEGGKRCVEKALVTCMRA